MAEKINKTKKQINEEWNELYKFVKIEILGYENKAMPKYMILRLKGMCDGNFIKNKNTQNQAHYEYTDILMTFRINKYKILKAMQSVTFKDETHKFNFIMKIIENDINNVVDMITRKEKSEQKTQQVNVVSDSIDIDNKAEYKKKTNKTTNKLLKDLW